MLRLFRRQTVFERKIGYKFKKISWLDAALTHKTVTRKPVCPAERLAFLGDAVLGFFISDSLFKTHSDWHEGQLTQTRSDWVKKETLQNVASHWQLTRYIKCGPGFRIENVSSHTLADMVESVLGAVYCDGGLKAASKLIKRALYHDKSRFKQDSTSGPDPKSKLQQQCQRQWQILPSYSIIDTQGPEHDRVFTVQVILDHQPKGIGQARTIKLAEHQAAQETLDQLKKEEDQ